MALKALDRLRLGDELPSSSDPIDLSAHLIQAGERRNGHRRAWDWVVTSEGCHGQTLVRSNCWAFLFASP